MSNRHDPIVPHVLYVADQHHPWRLAAYERLATRYHTPTTVNLVFGTVDSTVKRVVGKSGVIKQQTGVYCLPDDAAWDRVVARRGDLQAALDALADGLRQLGSYAKRLEQAGGIKKAPNPLAPAVISASDPDDTISGYFVSNLVPRIERERITTHTPKMLRGPSRSGNWESTFHQRDHFVCPDEAAWEHIQALRSAVKEQADAWKQLLYELGTYQTALSDKRYGEGKRQKADSYKAPTPDQAARDIAATHPPAPAAPSTWPALEAPLIYGHHRSATAGGVAHVWRPTPRPRSKERHETLCRIVMTEAPHRLNLAAHPRLCTDCRRAAEQPTKEEPMPRLAETRQVTQTDLDAALLQRLQAAGYRWQSATQTPDGHWHHVVEIYNKGLQRGDQLRARRDRLLALLETAHLAPREAPGALSTALQDCARRYVAAREKAGNALLEMSHHLAEARRLAKHGDWYTFLESIGTSEDQADRLLDIHNQAESNPAFADAVRRNFLNPTTAALLARPSTPPAVVEQVLRQPEPPTKREIEVQIRGVRGESKSRTGAGFDPADDEHIKAVHKLLNTLDQWADSARPGLFQQAYSHARQVRELTAREALFATIDRAMDGTATTPAERPAPAPTKSDVPTITISTDEGPFTIEAIVVSKDLALHVGQAAGDKAYAITHRPTGKQVAGFDQRVSAEGAFAALAALDWSGVQGTSMPPALAQKARAILARYAAPQEATPAQAAPDPNLCSRCGKPATGGGAMTVDDKRFCPNCAGAYLQETAAAQAQQARQAPAPLALPAVPTLPPDPRAAVDAWLPEIRAILARSPDSVMFRRDQMEAAVAHIEALRALVPDAEDGPVPTLAALERGLLAPIAYEVASIEDWIADTGADAKPAWIATHQDELHSWRKRLDSLADHPDVDDSAWSALSTQIGQVDRALAELAERAGAAPELAEVTA